MSEEVVKSHYGLRPKKATNLLDYFKKIDQEIGYESSSDEHPSKSQRRQKEEDQDFTDKCFKKVKKQRKNTNNHHNHNTSSCSSEYS